MNNQPPLPSFQQYQLAFTQHLRDRTQAAPAGIIKKRMAVYQEIVFNNLFQSVSSCFPVAQQVLGKRRWLALVKTFFRTHAANSPFFKDIPAEFLTFLSQSGALKSLKTPDFLMSLCHYEWIELALTTQKQTDINKAQPIETADDLLTFHPVFINPMAVLAYAYPVHQISAKYQPTAEMPTFLLVYRNAAFAVKFIALNATTYALVKLIEDEHLSGKAALTRIAENLNHPDPEIITHFGLSFLQDFYAQGLIIGVEK